MQKRTFFRSAINTIDENVEILVNVFNNKKVYPLDQKRTVPSELIKKFNLEWVNFYLQSQELKKTSPNDKSIDNEIYEKLIVKGKTLKSILFGKNIHFNFKNKEEPIIFSVDNEYGNLPLEILPTNDKLLCETVPIIKQVRGVKNYNETTINKNKIGLLIFNGNFS